MESLWKKTQKDILEEKELKEEKTADVCIIGGRNHRNKHCIQLKQRREKSNNIRKR